MQKSITDVRLTPEEYASLRGCSTRYVRKLCQDGNIDCYEVKGNKGRGGITYEIPLISLTEKEIKRYLRNQEKLEKQQKPEKPESETKVISLEYEKLSAEERQELNMKNKILDDWLNYRCQEKPKGKTLAEIDEDYVNFIQLQYPELPISVRSIRRWDKTRRTKGEAGLVDSRGKHGNHKSKMTQVIADIFEFYYLDESRKSAAMCMKLTELEIKKLAKEDPTLQVLLDNFPALRTFERWVEEKIPYPVVQYFRYGSKACKDKCLPYVHRSYEDLYSNDVWVCDNHTFDVIIQKDEKPLRVYLTAFLDVRSRKVVGHYVTLTPSSDATLYALRNGIENYGIPKRILADNGREFLTYDIGGRGFRKHSKAAELDPANIMERLGIDFRTALVRNARAKIIERTFLTVKEEFSKLFLAYTGGNTQERPESLKYIGKDLTKQVILEDFETFVRQYIEGYYNQRENTGIGMHGMTPNQVYKKYLVEQRVAPQEVLNLMMLRSTRLQKVQRAGVKLTFYDKDIWFKDPALMAEHFGEKVYVRYNPTELETVRVYDEQDRYILTATQDKELGYFASKEEVAQKMKEQRQYEKIVKSYRKDKQIKATDALDLIMEAAADNMKTEEHLSPDIIRIMKSPDAKFNELCIQQAVGGDVLDWAAANERIRNSRNSRNLDF